MTRIQAIKKLATAALQGGKNLMVRPASEENGAAVLTNGCWLIYVYPEWLPSELRYLPTGTYTGKLSDLTKDSDNFPNLDLVMESARKDAVRISWVTEGALPIMVDTPLNNIRCRVYWAGRDEANGAGKVAMNLKYYEAMEELYPGASWKSSDKHSAVILESNGVERAIVMPIRLD
jgi:hypothetical protein